MVQRLTLVGGAAAVVQDDRHVASHVSSQKGFGDASRHPSVKAPGERSVLCLYEEDVGRAVTLTHTAFNYSTNRQALDTLG